MGNALFAGREGAFQESFFIPSPPMGERARVRGKEITRSLPAINALAIGRPLAAE